MPNAAPEPSAITRFQHSIDALIGKEAAAEVRLGIAVSGGPDSMAMLWLATHAYPGRVEAATVDHGLRAEARAEAEMVGRWCTEQGVPHAILAPAQPITGSIQASARAARYALLHQWREARGIAWLSCSPSRNPAPCPMCLTPATRMRGLIGWRCAATLPG